MAATSFYINFKSLPGRNVDCQKTEECCTICLVKLAGKIRVRKLPCAHIFHDTCLRESLAHNYQCPNCRGDIFILPDFVRHLRAEYGPVPREELAHMDARFRRQGDTWYYFEFPRYLLEGDSSRQQQQIGSDDYEDDEEEDSTSSSDDSDEDEAQITRSYYTRPCNYCNHQIRGSRGLHKFFCKIRYGLLYPFRRSEPFETLSHNPRRRLYQ